MKDDQTLPAAKDLIAVKNAMTGVVTSSANMSKGLDSVRKQTELLTLTTESYNANLINNNLNLSLLNVSIAANTAALTANAMQFLLTNDAINLFNASIVNATLSANGFSVALALASAMLSANTLYVISAAGAEVLATQSMQGFSEQIVSNSELLGQNAEAILNVANAYTELSKAAALATLATGLHAVAAFIDTQILDENNKKLKENNDNFKEQHKAVGLSVIVTALHCVATALDTSFLKKNTDALYMNAAAQWVANGAKAASIILATFGAGAVVVGAALAAGVAIASLGGGMSFAGALTSRASTPQLPSSGDKPLLPPPSSGGNLLPMASGGIVSAPTIALVGEGRYPEAVVPLGNSPQFDQMKNDIANAVLQGIAAAGLGRNRVKTNGDPVVVELILDGEKFARTVIPAIDKENRRRGYPMQVRRV